MPKICARPGITVLLAIVCLVAGLALPGASFAGHKLDGSQCVDCHLSSGSVADVLTDSHLIRNDVSKITKYTTAGWSTGQPLPCVYCHDDASRSVRENMIGVEEQFNAVSISKHPVDPYTSTSLGDGDPGTLDCVDCHDVGVVSYVGQGSSPGTTPSPNIHNQDVAAVGWTPEPGTLDYTATFRAWVSSATSPYNAGGNTFCTEQCHDGSSGSGFDAGQGYHQYDNPLVSLENGSNFFTPSAITGCLNEPGTGSGCHAVHNARDNTDLITVYNWGTTNFTGRGDCGTCHVFDDGSPASPLPRSSSDFNARGHGQFAVVCLDCHDPDIGHFNADGTPATGDSAGRLNFVLDNTPSQFSSPARSSLSICISSGCHDTYQAHTSSTNPSHPVGCLDCHDPHGYGVGSNVKMMRQSTPVASPAVTLTYANSGDWYNSAQPSGFTNWGCDSADCHPQSINAIMDTTTGTHEGGLGLKSGCENCHQHTGGDYSWAARGCDQCHGGSGLYWPSDTVSGDDGGIDPNDAGRHGIHRQALEAQLGYASGTTNHDEQKTMCGYCHRVGDSDHTSSTRADVFTAGYARAIWDTPGQAPSDTNASFVAGTNAGTCANVDCHNSKTTATPYLWYEAGVTNCTMCHTAGGGGIVDPVSGLHDENPRVSGVAHDDSFAYSGSTGDCTTCHTSSPSSAHYDGNDDSTIGTSGNTAIALTAGAGFADAPTPSCAVTITGCHLEADVGETWSRFWHENSDLTDGTECTGCHGDYDSWNAGVMHAGLGTKGNSIHANTGDLIYPCTDCHGLGASTGNYAFTSSTQDWDGAPAETSDHGNGLITMNFNGTSWARSGGRSGCSTCHTGATGTPHSYDFPQTSWAADTVIGDVPPTGCDSCHGDKAGAYWPLGSTYPNTAGRHQAHIDALILEAGFTTSENDQKAMCQYCHDDPTSPPAGNSGHFENPPTAPADVGSFNRIWDSAADSAGAAATYDTATDSCAGIDCHNNRTAAANFSWYASSTSACLLCHVDVTAAATSTGITHVSHTGAAATLGVTVTCGTCHESATDWGTGMAPATDHRNGSWTLEFTHAGDWTGAAYSGSWQSGTSGSCSTNPCHNDGAGGIPSVSGYTWGSTIEPDCTTCHETNMVTLSHDEHLGAAASFGIAPDCADCHAATSSTSMAGQATHIDAQVTMAAGAASYTGGVAVGDTNFGTCETNACHNDGTDGLPETYPYIWGSVITNCTECHAYPGMATLSHDEHLGASGTYGIAIDCGDCHTAETSVTHIDQGVSLITTLAGYTGGVSVGDTSVGTCSTSLCHNDGTGAAVATSAWGTAITDPNCGICHQYPNDSGRHTVHVANTDYVAGGCGACHEAETSVTHIDTAVDTAGSVSSFDTTTGGCVNSCHVVTAASTGDWLDTADLACRDCHSGTNIGGGSFLPVSGLHDLTPTVSGVTHAEALSPSTGCGVCHTGMVPMSSDPVSHVNGTWEADGSTQTETRGLFADYTDGVPGSCSGSPGTVGAGGCHDGPGDAGSWARLWDTSAASSTGTQCANCHGDFNNGWVTGMVDHDRASMTDTSNHQNCSFCHVYDDPAYTLPIGWGGGNQHGDDLLTMNSDATVLYSQGSYGCDGNVCHYNDPGHQLSDSAWAVTLVDGPDAKCTGCHGTAGVRYYPDSGVQNGPGYPNRGGAHQQHVSAIASRNALSTTNDETCDWCHPGGLHSGDHSAAPADLMDGSSTYFKNAVGATDAGTATATVSTQDGVSNVTCSNIDCHYEKSMPQEDWYGGAVGSFEFCNYCHFWYDPGSAPYNPGDLPAAHDIHVDEPADGGYWLDTFWCFVCHPAYPGVNEPGHINGAVDVVFTDDSWGRNPVDGNEATVSNGGPLTGTLKFGAGTSADYYSCSGIYCHGDFDDAGIGGGNTGNTPNWYNTTTGADCGSCHGDTGGSDQPHQALPVTGDSGTIHLNHVDMSPAVTVDCGICHFDASGTNGTYGNNEIHADGNLDIAFDSTGTPDPDYEAGTAALAGTYGARTCSAVVCHNGVSTPTWSDSSTVVCGSCHQDTAAGSALPSWESSVSGSHTAHANTDADYTDCDTCHTGASSYTATGGTNHQNLIVDIAPAAGTYLDADGAAGVNYSGDGVDDGTCSSVWCHGSSTPQWGGTVACGSCHTDGGLPPTSGSHSGHLTAVSGSNADYSECVACHGDNAYDTDVSQHIDNDPVVAGTGVSYEGTGGTCTTVVCHSPSTGSTAHSTTWGVASSIGCSECHYYKSGVFPDSADNAAAANSIGGAHNAHFDASPVVDCASCHTVPGPQDTTHISDRSGANDGAVLTGMANALSDEATIANTFYITPATDWVDSTDSCSNTWCHDPSDSAYAATWGTSSANCDLCHSSTDPGTGSHTAHNTPSLSGTFGLTIGCVDCHVDNGAGTSHTIGAIGFTTGVSYANTTCSTNACHNDGTGQAPALAYTWGKSYSDCGICHDASPGSNAHFEHLGSNALAATDAIECVACHTGSADASGKAGGANHLNASRDVIFASTYDYESGTASRSSVGNSTSCSAVICHNGVDTPTWGSGAVNCGQCHQDAAASSALPGWESSVSRSHLAHADTDTDYTECDNCHPGATSYTATGGVNHQNLVVDVAPAGGSYSDTDGAAGVNWAATDYLDDGTCDNTACHGSPSTLPQWGVPGTVTCGSCHANGMPPVSGAHASHFANSNTDYTECVVCHGDNGNMYQSDLGAHIDGNVDVSGTGVNWSDSATAGTPDDDTCTTTVCHSASTPVSWGDSGVTWDTTAVSGAFDCGECHYWDVSGSASAAGNAADANSISSDHGNHFNVGYYCTDCHGALPADGGHISSAAATNEGAVLVSRANADRDLDTVEVTVATWNEGTDSCSNAACHNPSGGSYAATWQISSATCDLCHSSTDPGTGSHTSHNTPSLSGTFGLTIGCMDCHVDNGAGSSHSLGALGFTTGVSYTGTTPGTCGTNACHNDGTGSAPATAYTWGNIYPNCSICHQYPNDSGRHTVHVANSDYVAGGCGVCHQAETSVTHIDTAVDTAGSVSSFDTTTGGCVNSCHVVTAASAGDWLDTADLVCRDCHSGSYIGGGAYLPVSGLHDLTPTVSGVTHAEALSPAAGCGVCHTGMVPLSSDPGSHIDGTWEADGASQTETRGLFTDYTDGTPGSCSGSPGAVGAGGCHDGPGDAGNWSRLWDTSAGAVDGTQCANCHGDFNTGWVTGMVDHDRPAMTDTSNHQNCSFCHVYDDSAYTLPIGWGGGNQHGNDQLTMNSDPSVDYNQTTFVCDGGVCHTNDAPAHALTDSAWIIEYVDGPNATCTGCHGTNNVRYYPDSAAQNGTAYPNRVGYHDRHVQAIASVNSLSTTNADTCVWCHPGGAHSGDQLAAPADLHDGSATHFRDILGNTDSGESVAQSGAGNTVSCSNINCHYNNTMAETDWYTGVTANCEYCHVYTASVYTPGALPNAHDIHVDENADGGYRIAGGYACSICHPPMYSGPGMLQHQNGVIELPFGELSTVRPVSGNETAVAGAGPLAGVVKYGGGNATDYPTCEGIYCHGDFGDNSIDSVPMSGGNASNAPNWYNTLDGSACGTCHGDTGQSSVNMKAAPVAGSAGSLHPNHVAMGTSPQVICSDCHYNFAVPTANGTYGDPFRHADGNLILSLNNFATTSTLLDTGYQGGTAAMAGSFGNRTCTTVICHNGVTTPVWSDASIPGFICGSCHHDGTNSAGLPTWSPNVSGSHAAHADTDTDYTDCENCHAGAIGYTVSGGGSHLDLIVDLSLPGVGATYIEVGAPNGSGGVNWLIGGPGDDIDNGTCDNTSCHGSPVPLPQWGNPSSVACGSCHTDGGLPPATGSHTAHVNKNAGAGTVDLSECVTCHGDYSGTHADGTIDVNGSGITFDTTARTCRTSVCHSPVGGAQPTSSVWGSAATLDCNECHYHEATPTGTNNSGNANSISGLSHNGHFDAAGRTFVCLDCHGTVTDTSHISGTTGADDAAALTNMANAVPDEAFIDTSGSWFATGSWFDTTNTCTNVCHDPSVSGSYQASWGGTNSSCTFCHSLTDPGTGSHSAHMTAQGTYGLTVDCVSCHPDNGTVYDHMDGAVTLSLTSLTYGGDLGAPYATTFGTCSTTTCHNDGTGAAVATSAWDTSIADPNCGICHASAPSTMSHNAHLSPAATYGLNADCDSCHASGGQDQSMGAYASHIDSQVSMSAGAASYDGGVAVGDTGYGSCLTNVCHSDGAAGPPARSYTWGVALADDCASCHSGDGMATFAHDPHLASNALAGTNLTECVTCHSATATASGAASAGSHLDASVNLVFQAAYGYEGAAPDRAAGAGSTTTCSAVVCHNGVITPEWRGSVACGTCHQDAAGTSPLPTWEAGVTGSHGAHADTNGVYTDCDKCHGVVAGVYTAVGGTNHQNLVVELASLPGAGAAYSDVDPAGVNWVSGDGVDDGTCSNVTCHGASAPVWGGTVACGSCHTDGQLPPTTGAHTAHFISSAGISGSDSDYTECVACHGNYTASHADGTVDVDGAGVAYDSTANTCNTGVCHSPVNGTLATASAWTSTETLDCNECHYYEAIPASSANNAGSSNAVSGASHNGHFDAAGRSFACVDCHGTVVDLTHISSVAGSDGAVLVDRANAVPDEAFIDTSGGWFATGSWVDSTNTCTNVCHDPSQAGVYSATWGSTYASCTLCHSVSDPATGSHSAHLAAGVYGGAIDCDSCHPSNGTVYDHMDGAVALSLANLTYSASTAAPYNTTFGTCSTTTCHNDGQGVARATSVWGNNNPVDDCGICHEAVPSTQAHNEHLAHPAVDCTDCHAATSATSMSGQAAHLDDTVDLASRAAGYNGGVAVGDTNFGSCDSGACHDAVVDIAWDATPASCTDCHYNSADVNSFDGQDKTASVVASGQWSGFGHSAQGIGCLDCHSLSAGHDFSAALDGSSNPFRLGTTGAPYAGTPDVFCSNTAAGCHNAAPANAVMSHTDENMAGAKRTWPSWDPKCVDCHDPHGDGSNLSMIQADLFDAGSTTTGVPIASDADTVTFTTRDGIGTGSYADTPGADGICQECHTATQSFVDNAATAVTASHPGSGLSPCTNCHKHDAAFEPSGCDSCHGDQAGSYWPDGSTYPNTAGRHQAHITALQGEAGFGTSDADQKAMCLYCHNDPTSPPAGAGGHYETPTWTAPANVGDFNRIWDSAADSAGAAAIYDTASDTCAGVDCHNNLTTAAGFSWYAASTSACGMCHNDVTAAATATGITHTNHTGATGSFGLTVTCDTCHYATAWDSAAPGTGHRDGSWTFEFDYSVGSWGSVAYSGSWEAITYGSCGTNTCHNDGRGAAPATACTWGTAYDDCNTCHIDSPLTSSHDAHLASTVTFGLTIGCADCHGVNGQQQASHIDSQVTLTAYAASYDGGVAVGDTNFGSCLTNFCHNDGAGGAPAIPGYTWSQAYDDCNTCHTDSPVTGNHGTHLTASYGPGAACGDCHAANANNTSMAGQASHISGTVDFAAATTLGTTAACETCHGGPTPAGTAKAYWAATTGQWLTDGGYCESCHGDYTPAQIGTVDAPVRAGALFDSAGHGKVTDTATWGGSACADCHDEYDVDHINGSLGDNRLNTVNGNDYGTSVNEFCATSCHSGVQTAHYDNGWTGGGASDDGNRCDLCHDPHGQSGHDAMIAAAIGSPAKTVVGFTDKTQRSSYVVASPGAGNYGVCQVCHDPAEVIHFNQTTSEGATHFGAAVCTDCHFHTTAVAFEVSCGTCHAEAGSLPLAHDKHALTQTTGGVQIVCDVCHGVGAETGSHPGHAAGGTTVQVGNITLLAEAGYEATYSTTLPSWYDSTWNLTALGTPDVSYVTGTSDFTCDNVRCHGGESVVFNQSADSGAATYSDVCFNCHNITPASFQLPGSGVLYQATNAAANYVGPISGFSRGGHGDTRIGTSNDFNHPWFEDVAPGWSVPLGCTACHDEAQDHFPVASSDRYRVGTVPVSDASQTTVTNLCISCHSEETDFHFLSPPKHPSDYYDTDWTGGVTRSSVLVTDGAMSVFSTFDPVTAGVGIHIDQYVDHWEFWGATGASPTANDDARFLPMGDSLDPAQNFNNDTGDLVTCVTCHNPHGTDLFVSGETPGSGSTVSQIPANRMLRLRDQDDELCSACHR